ncbi:MAG: XrtA/PEP-CTERM system amidotransferase [Gammaproteobacteria bacterium]
MCGIVGIFDLRERREIDRSLLARMNDSQTHRGPDGSGLHAEPGVGLGHRRLSIIDLSGGHQPMHNQDQTVTVTYNGEIYNFRSLREELEQEGYEFRTNCDTEVILHAWSHWGEACVSRFRGMFAFAVWDRSRRTLFLARDRLGIKPLYYAELPNGQFIFGSELKALLIHPQLRREIQPQAVEDYFAFGYVPDPKTILRNVFKLAPGTTLLLRRGQRIPQPRQYWDVSFAPLPAMAEQEIAEEIIARLREAVRIRLVADVPLGAFLSGGVDSSSVVAMMAGLSDEPVKTCAVSFGDPQYNESQFAAAVARKYGTDHQVQQVDPKDVSLIDQLVTIYDEPYADSSAMPTYRVCELARRFVTVALSGDGGDENFAGYRRYRWHAYEERVRGLLPQFVRRSLFGPFGSIYPKLDWAPKVLRAKSTLEALARDSLEGYMHSVSIFPANLRSQLFADAFRRELQGYPAIEVLRNHVERAPTADPLSLVQYLDFKTYLPGDILTKVDRASMAHGLEVRVPILDHQLVDWVSGLTPKWKLRGREGKYIFKKALGSFLPQDILYRPKMGFAVPIASWFRGPMRQRVREAVLGSSLTDSGIFNPGFLERLVDQHQRGARDHSAVLWALLMFAGFQQRVMNEQEHDVGGPVLLASSDQS